MVTLIKAARGRITTYHGEDIGRGFPHRGIDIGHGDAQPADLRLGAPAAGRIVAAGRDGSYGNRVIIEHADGTRSLIAHMASIAVSVEQNVAQGEVIGVMGNTGTVYVHAHQEYRSPAGVFLDPLGYMTTTAGGNATEIGDDEMSFEDMKRAALEGTLEALKYPFPRGDGTAASVMDVLLYPDSPKIGFFDRLLDRRVKRAGDQSLGGETSLRGVLAYYDSNQQAVLRAIASAAVATGASAEQVEQIVRAALADLDYDPARLEDLVRQALDGATITLDTE